MHPALAMRRLALTRIPRLAALIAAAVAAVLSGGSGVAHASPGHCLQSGICITVTTKPLSATHFIDVTGTPGNDNVQFTLIPAFGNNSLPHIGVNGFDTQVDAFRDTVITVNGLNGNDTISLAGLNTVGTGFIRIYTKATLESGRGNSTLIAANSGDNVLIGGPGHNLLLARNGRADIVQGSGQDTAQVDKIDKVTGVVKFLP
jgi:hypothetical protein